MQHVSELINLRVFKDYTTLPVDVKKLKSIYFLTVTLQKKHDPTLLNQIPTRPRIYILITRNVPLLDGESFPVN